MKKPNENSIRTLALNPTEERSILINFERYVANYGKKKKSLKQNKGQVIAQPKIETRSNTSLTKKTNTYFFSSVTGLAIAFFLMAFGLSAFSQNMNIWKGGTPGQENAWNCAKNWSDYKVPDEFSDVLIPNTLTTTFSNPTLEVGRFEINSIILDPTAQLTINKPAQLIVYEKAEGILKDNIILRGRLLVLEGKEESSVPVARISADKQH